MPLVWFSFLILCWFDFLRLWFILWPFFILFCLFCVLFLIEVVSSPSWTKRQDINVSTAEIKYMLPFHNAAHVIRMEFPGDLPSRHWTDSDLLSFNTVVASYAFRHEAIITKFIIEFTWKLSTRHISPFWTWKQKWHNSVLQRADLGQSSK